MEVILDRTEKLDWFVRIFISLLFLSIALGTLYDPVVLWLESPDGNMIWDILLQTLGIFITVTVIRRYLERQEEKRWLPVRQDLYSRLFSNADYLVGLLPPHYLPEPHKATYQFGYRRHTTYFFPEEFIARVVNARLTVFEDRVRALAEKPEIMEIYQEELNKLLGPSAIVCLTREPELNRLITDLTEWISNFQGTLETYRHVLETGRDPARRAGSSALQQACITFRGLMISGYRLRQWLAANAEQLNM